MSEKEIKAELGKTFTGLDVTVQAIDEKHAKALAKLAADHDETAARIRAQGNEEVAKWERVRASRLEIAKGTYEAEVLKINVVEDSHVKSTIGARDDVLARNDALYKEAVKRENREYLGALNGELFWRTGNKVPIP